MAKRKVESTSKATGNVIQGAMDVLFEHLHKASNGMACYAEDISQRTWGIPSNHISYRWLTDNVCFPMGRVIGIAGMKESCKSAYAATLVKDFLDCNPYSGALYLDTEKKVSGDLYNAIVGNVEEYGRRSVYIPAHTTESWQEFALESLSKMRDHEHSDEIPIIVVVDSLGGVDTQETSNRIEKEGGINPRNTGGMIKCKSHNEFFRYVNQFLYMKPFNFVYINHLSDDPNSPIQGSKRKPGGTGQDYHAVIDFWFSVVRGTPQDKPSRGFTEKLLKITVAKNSIGTSKRNVEIPYRWTKKADDPSKLEKVWFDWDAATAMLLSEDGVGSLKPKIREALTVTCNSNKYSCKELGLVGVTDTEMGEAIRNNVEMRERISDLLGINRMKVFEHMDVDKSIYEVSRYAAAPKTEAESEIVE